MPELGTVPHPSLFLLPLKKGPSGEVGLCPRGERRALDKSRGSSFTKITGCPKRGSESAQLGIQTGMISLEKISPARALEQERSDVRLVDQIAQILHSDFLGDDALTREETDLHGI